MCCFLFHVKKVSSHGILLFSVEFAVGEQSASRSPVAITKERPDGFFIREFETSVYASSLRCQERCEMAIHFAFVRDWMFADVVAPFCFLFHTSSVFTPLFHLLFNFAFIQFVDPNGFSLSFYVKRPRFVFAFRRFSLYTYNIFPPLRWFLCASCEDCFVCENKRVESYALEMALCVIFIRYQYYIQIPGVSVFFYYYYLFWKNVDLKQINFLFGNLVDHKIIYRINVEKLLSEVQKMTTIQKMRSTNNYNGYYWNILWGHFLVVCVCVCVCSIE